MPNLDYGTILMIVAVIALFYFMLIRPQQKRAKDQKNMMEAIKPGDRVMTISGIVGTVRHLGEKQAIIEISPGVEMTVVKGAISTQPVEDEFEYSDDAGAGEPETVGEPVSDLDPPTAADVPQAVVSPETATDGSTAWDNPNK
jgi:preprotein translocase subunit YajC